MKHRSASIVTLLFALSMFVLGPAVLVLYVDPFQVYHRTFFKQAGYSQEQGYQHAGWINTLLADPEENYTSIVIGSSVMANYKQALFDRLLPQWGRVMNLSINGSVPKMQAASAQRALAVNPRIKNVLWDIHFFYLLDAEGGEAFPYYLYNGSFLDDADYFFNITNLKSSVAFLLGKFDGFLLGVDENGSWYQSLFAAGRFDVYKSIEMRKKMLADIEAAPLLSPLDQQAISALQYPDVEKYLLDVILPLCNSDKQINIMFSPVTRYYYASQGDDRHVYRQIYLRRYIMEKTLACTNMKVFAFDDADWIVADLTNYADNFHYQIGVNDYVLQSIAEDRHHLSPANIDQYERDFIAAINAYRQQFVAELAAMENAPADPAPPSPLQ